jgi:cytoskeletal protein RodZ
LESPDSMDDEHFGNCLRRAREEKSLTIGDVSASTKVPRSAIELLESGSLNGLPAHVFVRGFIRSYAKAVGIADAQPLGLYDRAINRESAAARAKSASPVVDPVLAGGAVDPGEEDAGRRRGLGLAVFVIILVLIATITLSLLLRRPPQSGEGLSQLRDTPAHIVAAAPSSSDTRA